MEDLDLIWRDFLSHLHVDSGLGTLDAEECRFIERCSRNLLESFLNTVFVEHMQNLAVFWLSFRTLTFLDFYGFCNIVEVLFWSCLCFGPSHVRTAHSLLTI